MKMLQLEIKGREQSRTQMHFELAFEAFSDFKLYMENAAKYTVECKLQKRQIEKAIWGAHIQKSFRSFMLQYLFAAMCLESFIYEYAASNLTDTYTKKYLDKLDLISKWVVIPRLVLGKEFPKDGQAFEHLREIKKERNKLVHSKSRPKITEEEREKELAQYDLKFSDRYSNKSAEKDLSISQWLVDIFNTLKKLEQESGKLQNWWQIIEV